VGVIEIDRFNVILDSLGTADAGDVATNAGRHLRAILPSDHLVARLSRHQFGVLMADASEQTCAELAGAVRRGMDRPIRAGDRDIRVTCSAGTVIHGQAAGVESAEDLLQAADEAVRAAQRNGQSQWVMFDPAVHAQAQAQASLEIELRDAIRTGAIGACYQPLLALGSGDGDDDDRIVGAEALASWTRADGSTVPAEHFMPVADALGLASQLGLQLLEQALDALLEWRREGVGVDQVWVNLAPGQLGDPGLAQEISVRLAVRGLNASCLVLEVSATDPIGTEQALSTLNTLRSLGIAVAIDDFGHSGTSLTALRSLPVSAIKVDHQLANELGRHNAVPRSIIQLCHSLDLRVVLEGVETMLQLRGAREIQADAVQGYAIARPMSAEDVTNLLSLRLPRDLRLR
jgi:diguanylate cyclase (GGDEF)-like protein